MANRYCVLINDENDGQTNDVWVFGPFGTLDKAEAFADRCRRRLARRPDAADMELVVIIETPMSGTRLRDAYSIIDNY